MPNGTVGLYVHASSDWMDAQRSINGWKLVHCLESDDIAAVDWLLLDVRFEARKVLQSLALWPQTVPLIALADIHQVPDEEYPHGCHLHDHVSCAELGSPLFWYKLKRARESFTAPLQLTDVSTPAYGLFQDIVNHSSDWIFLKDLEHRFLLASDSFARSAGLELRELLGKDDLQIGNSLEHVLGNPDKGWKGFWPQDDEVTQSGQLSVEENPHWDLYSKEERYLRTIRAPLKNAKGDVYALLVCSQDITDQKKNESLLEERTAMLARVTEEKRRADINRSRAEKAVAAKSKFLAAASHDLRQPLHAMGLFLDVLSNRVKGRPEQELVEQLQRSCSTLKNLFNGCLDISRLDAGIVERKDEDFRVLSYLEDTSQELHEQAREKGLNYTFASDDSVVRSDPLLLGRIFRNLVNNAIQNTEQGIVSVHCAHEGERIALAVSDTGKGIPDAEKSRIFNEFHQVDSSNARMGRGLGLGLAIVKRLCELLEIGIELESQVGKGSTFKLLISKGTESDIVVEQGPSEILELQGACVVIIDDDRYIRHGMETLLQTCGCQTISAAGACLAIEHVRSAGMAPDIIVADYHLSDEGTGADAIRRFRETWNKAIPAILVTGDTTVNSEEETDADSLRILHKPVSTELLLSTIASELE
ncbi:MAG: ATP-binding protein [Granulosicoccus sp.]